MRLSLGTLRRVPAAMRPPTDPAGLRIGIVHLGIGAFHQAHQAVFTEDADDGWGLCGVSQRSRTVIEQLVPQEFPGGRPAWEKAGALLTADVTPYEVIKLRMLNGSHSALAYLGALAGCETIADAMALR